MTTVRSAIATSPWWAQMYARYSYEDPSNQHYGHFNHSRTHNPLVIDSNHLYSVDLERHCSGTCSYNIGAVDPSLSREAAAIDQCSDATGAPFMCARSILGPRNNFAGNGWYDRLG